LDDRRSSCSPISVKFNGGYFFKFSLTFVLKIAAHATPNKSLVERVQLVSKSLEVGVFPETVRVEASDAVVHNGIDQLFVTSEMFIHKVDCFAKINGFVGARTSVFALFEHIDICLRLETGQVVDISESVQPTMEQDRCGNVIEVVWAAGKSELSHVRRWVQHIGSSIDEAQKRQSSRWGEQLKVKLWTRPRATFKSSAKHWTGTLEEGSVNAVDGFELVAGTRVGIGEDCVAKCEQ
jgi:hypothetical protein